MSCGVIVVRYNNNKMQCVKLRSVMGSYLNIHLNLFPIYVLLLLLTLSHGRPSAKVRETREEGSVSANKSHRQQLKDKWYQLSNLSPPSSYQDSNVIINSVSNEYNSVVYGTSQPISHHLKDTYTSSDQVMSNAAARPEIASMRSTKNLVATKSIKRATGSRKNEDAQVESNHHLSHENRDDVLKNPMKLKSSMSHTPAGGPPKKVHQKNKHSSSSSAVSRSSMHISNGNGVDSTPLVPFPANIVIDSESTKNRSLKWNANGKNESLADHITAKDSSSTSSMHIYTDYEEAEETNIDQDHLHNLDEADGNDVAVGGGDALIIDHSAPQLHHPSSFHKMDEPQRVDIFVEEGETGSQQQLVTFRQNILRSLGHHEAALQTNFTQTNVTLDYTDEDTLTKYNITKEEYLEAYQEYLKNVKNRRLANRGLVGVKDRRKNAVTIAKTYYDNGTDLFSIGTKVLKLFRFDMDYGATKQGTDVRIQRVVLTMPAMCQLTGHLRNSTELPDLRELSELATLEDDDCSDETHLEKERLNQIDLTRNLTSWSVRNRKSSPFIVMAICSRDGISKDSLEQATVSSQEDERHQRRHRHSHSHGSTLKVVTKEFLKPTPEAQLKRRIRRAAPTEPSTLQSFTEKRDSGRGRECANTRHGKTCCRRSLKIKFSDLGISDVILEPKEFDAHVCDGRCNARRVAYASTHAMFQHILHQTKGKKFAPRPCCVPTALTELDVLHLDPKGNRNGGPKLIVTILKDAIVKECGCS